MPLDLPTPGGDANTWGTKLNAALNALEAGKETPAGAQAKADAAETDAKAYTDTEIVDLDNAHRATFVRHLSPSGDTTGAADTAAIRANEDAGLSTRLVAGEIYYVTGLVKKSNCDLFLNGATVKLPNGANNDVIISEGFATHSGTSGNLLTSGITKAGIYGPGVIDGNKANQTTNVASLTADAVLPTSTITVNSTTGFPTSGKLYLMSSAGPRVVAYTGKTATTFTGCTLGSGTAWTGTEVYHAGWGVRCYWYDCVLGGTGPLDVRNCIADGIWTEWGGSQGAGVQDAGSMVSTFDQIKAYNNNRHGIVAAGPHDSYWSRISAFANAESGVVTGLGGMVYMSQLHAWGSPQVVGLDCYTETRVQQGALEVPNVPGSRGLKFTGVEVTFLGRIFAGGAGPGIPTPLGGNIGIEMYGNAAKCNIDAVVADCDNGALLVKSDGGNNDLRLMAVQTNGAGVVRFITSVAAASVGVDVNTFAGAGTLNVASTSGFPTSGGVMVSTSNGPKLVTYTGTTATTFTGCTSTGAGTISSGGTVTFVKVLNNGPTNDLDQLATTTTLDLTTGGGTPCPGVVTRQRPVKKSGVLTPSATADTYGTAFTVTAPGTTPGLGVGTIGAFSATGISAETLNFQLVFTYADGTVTTRALSTGSYGVSANNGGWTLAAIDWYALTKDNIDIRSIAVQMKSTKASSTASITAYYIGKF